MLVVKRLPWILLGLALGIGITTAPRAVAQERAGQEQVLTDHPAAGFTRWKFVSDSHTHSCWLAAIAGNGRDVTALAPAPPQACQ